MKYRVIIVPQAENDLKQVVRYIRRQGAAQAAREWLAAARKKIKTLTDHPERALLAPESSSFHEPIREWLHGSGNRGTYRILFVILNSSVFVLRVRHESRLPLEPGC